MTKKEFVRLCMLCGYASKKNAIKYAKEKEVLTEEDFQKVFSINERENDIKHGILSMRCKGDGDYLIDLLNHKPTPWRKDYDHANRGIKDWDKGLEDLE